jgi:hypothetical protein
VAHEDFVHIDDNRFYTAGETNQILARLVETDLSVDLLMDGNKELSVDLLILTIRFLNEVSWLVKTAYASMEIGRRSELKIR